MTYQVAVENEAAAAGLSATMARKALRERSDMLDEIFEQAGADFDPAKVTAREFKDGAELATFIRNVNAELSYIGKRVSEFDELDRIKAENGRLRAAGKGYDKDPARFAPGDRRPEPKSFADVLAASGALAAGKQRQRSNWATEEFDAKAWLQSKTVFETGAGWAPESTRTGRVVLDEQREIAIIDVIPSIPTTQAAIVYMEETTFTNAAAERAEGGAYAESALALTERTSTVRSIGTSLPVTDEQLADVEGVSAYLDTRLGFMVRQRLDGQIIAGNGTPPNLMGTLNVSGINSQAKGVDSVPDAVYKGIDLCRVTGRAEPNVVLAHPTDWQGVRLLKTADGVYIWGSPMDAGPARIWGLPVVLSTAVTENTMIVGDYARFAMLHVRRGLEIQTGFTNDDFTDGRVTYRAGIRVALVHYRPSAFTQVTGV